MCNQPPLVEGRPPTALRPCGRGQTTRLSLLLAGPPANASGPVSDERTTMQINGNTLTLSDDKMHHFTGGNAAAEAARSKA